MQFKRMLVASPFGAGLAAVQERAAILRSAIGNTEQIGTLANDVLASRLIVHLCENERVFLDVGAHIGSMIARVKRAYPNAHLLAVEAIPEKAARLRRTFPSATVLEFAAAHETGVATFYVNESRSGFSSLRQSSSNSCDSIRPIEVQLRRLDDAIDGTTVYTLKVDVEGAEPEVFLGATRILSHDRPIVMFESGPGSEPDAEDRKRSMFRSLTDLDFCVLVPNRVAHLDEGLSEDGFVESHRYPRRTTNYFAVPREKRDAVREKSRRLQW